MNSGWWWVWGFFWGWWKCSKIVMVTQSWECVKNHWIVHFKWWISMACDLDFNKAVTENIMTLIAFHIPACNNWIAKHNFHVHVYCVSGKSRWKEGCTSHCHSRLFISGHLRYSLLASFQLHCWLHEKTVTYSSNSIHLYIAFLPQLHPVTLITYFSYFPIFIHSCKICFKQVRNRSVMFSLLFSRFYDLAL